MLKIVRELLKKSAFHNCITDGFLFQLFVTVILVLLLVIIFLIGLHF